MHNPNNKIEYYQLQLEAGLSNSKAATFFKVSIATVKRWRNGKSSAPHAVIIGLKSLIQRKPVDKVM